MNIYIVFNLIQNSNTFLKANTNDNSSQNDLELTHDKIYRYIVTYIF